MNLKFTKMHGLGNDFMVIDAINQQVELGSQRIAALANRNFGVGFDQLLLVARSEFPLTHAMLEEDLGITYLGHRHRLLGTLQQEAENYCPSIVLAETTETHRFCSYCTLF